MSPDTVLTAFVSPGELSSLCTRLLSTRIQGRGFPAQHSAVNHGERLPHPCNHILSDEKSKQRLCELRVFRAQDMGTSMVSWMILHKVHRSPKLPGAAVSRASWTAFRRKHLLEMDGGNQACLDPPLPMPLHLVSSIQQEGGQGRQLLSLVQGESPTRRLSQPSPPQEPGHLPHMQRGALQDGPSGGLVHLSTQMFGHLFKISEPLEYPTWGY